MDTEAADHFRDLAINFTVPALGDILSTTDRSFPIKHDPYPLTRTSADSVETHPRSASHLLVNSLPLDNNRFNRNFLVHSPELTHYHQNYTSENVGEAANNLSKKDHPATSIVRTRRRKTTVSERDRVCTICGEPASGYNFDRLTCESCKAFFRRNALKPRDKIKACSLGGGCAIEGNQRKHCPSCRLEKCFAVGMKSELILPPEKLEQRAKPRRRKQGSPLDDNCSPPPRLHMGSHSHGGSVDSAPMQLGSELSQPSTMAHPPLHFTPNNEGQPSLLPNTDGPYSQSSATTPSILDFSPAFPRPLHQFHTKTNQTALGPSDPLTSESHRFSIHPTGISTPTDQWTAPKCRDSTDHYLTRPVPCRRTYGQTLCRHPRCHRIYSRRGKSSSVPTINGHGDELVHEPDSNVHQCLRDCIQRIREPFTPEEPLETSVAVTLEQEYNRMDPCIRRIIRVVKLLPYFSEIGKPAQLSLLRSNIYGLVVIYSSFFFESDIRKLRYPVVQSDGQMTTVTISLLDSIITSPSPTTAATVAEEDLDEPGGGGGGPTQWSNGRNSSTMSTDLSEEFELYKSNTLTALAHLDHLIQTDDIVRVCLLAIKLFTMDENIQSDQVQLCVSSARQAYLLFLWSYLHWREGPKRSRSATKLYARLLIAFVDLRTLEIRMTEFAKLLSLDGLSPLMREVCSQRALILGRS